MIPVVLREAYKRWLKKGSPAPERYPVTAFSHRLRGGNINAHRYGGDFLNTGSRHEREDLADSHCIIVCGRFAGNFAANPAAVGADKAD